MGLYEDIIAKLAADISPDTEDEETDEQAAEREHLREIIGRGWETFFGRLFGEDFVDVMAPHHREAVSWFFESRLAILKGGKPEYWAYFPIWSRGHMKSTVARRIAVAEAVMQHAFGLPAYVLYVSRNKEMAKKHASSVETLLGSVRIKRLCPSLSQVKRSEQGTAKGWAATFLNSKAGVFHFGGLDEGLAGGNVDDVRPTLIVPDDIDGREESQVISESRFGKLTNEVLPMRQHDTLTFFAQNLISRYGVMYRIHTGQERVLTNRKPTAPVPAIIGLETEPQTVDGIVRDVIIAGTPTWKYYDLSRCQEEINTIGLKAFMKECQHEVRSTEEGLILQSWNDRVHVITETEFASVFGERGMPGSWYKYLGHDWARTNTKFHANVALWMAFSPQNARLPGFAFIFHPMTFPADVQPDTCAVRFLDSLQPMVYAEGEVYTWEELIQHGLTRDRLDQHIGDATKLIEMRRQVVASVVPKYAEQVLQAHNVRRLRMSHERDDIRRVYHRSYGLPFAGTNPGERGGIQQINELMRVDMTLPHPFRSGELGYTRCFVVVPDNKLERPLGVSPEDMTDHDRLRYQFSEWRNQAPKLTETGEKIDGVLKLNDDFGQALQMLLFDSDPFNAPLSTQEQVTAHLAQTAPHLMAEAVAALPENQQPNALQARLQKLKELQDQVARGQGKHKNPMKRRR